jgi:methionyl-tRNA synthetase
VNNIANAAEAVPHLIQRRVLHIVFASTRTFVVARLDFLTSLSGQELREAFADSFEANEVDQAAPAIVQFLNLVNVDVKSRDRWTIAIEKNADGSHDLVFQGANGVVSKIVGANLMRPIMSHWIGRLAFRQEQPAFLKNFLCGS